jgi:hypothetical protein
LKYLLQNQLKSKDFASNWLKNGGGGYLNKQHGGYSNMNTITMIVVIIIFATALAFLGAIVYAFFFSKGDVATDNLLTMLRQRKGGDLRTIAFVRKMLEIPTDKGKILVGYWKQRDVGERMLMPYFTVRWCPAEPCGLPEFILREKRPLTGKFVVAGFQKREFTYTFSDKSFMIFVRESLSELDHLLLNQKLAANLPFLISATTVAEINHMNKAMSCRCREAIMDVDQAERLMDKILAFFRQM